MVESINPLKVFGNSSIAWSYIRNLLIDECQGRCFKCGAEHRELHVHHINGYGLDNRRENLVVLCTLCHSEAGKKGRKAKRMGRNGKRLKIFRKGRDW